MCFKSVLSHLKRHFKTKNVELLGLYPIRHVTNWSVLQGCCFFFIISHRLGDWKHAGFWCLSCLLRIQLENVPEAAGGEKENGAKLGGPRTINHVDESTPGVKSDQGRSESIIFCPPWIWKGVSATLQSGRCTLSYVRGRLNVHWTSCYSAIPKTLAICICIYSRGIQRVINRDCTLWPLSTTVVVFTLFY